MKNNKLVLFVGLFTLLSQTQVQAKEICGEDSTLTCKQLGVVATMGGAETGAIGSLKDNVLSEMKFRKAEAFQNEHTKPILDIETPRSLTQSSIDDLAKEIGEGDRLAISYRMNEADNREYHLKQLRSKVSAAEVEHQNLLDNEFRLIHEGKTDEAKKERAKYNQKLAPIKAAVQKETEDILAGRKKVPVYTFTEKIEKSDGNSQAFRDFLKRNTEAGGTVTKITRFEAARVREWAKMAGKAVDQAKIKGAIVAKRVTIGAAATTAVAIGAEAASSYTKARLTEKSNGAR